MLISSYTLIRYSRVHFIKKLPDYFELSKLLIFCYQVEPNRICPSCRKSHSHPDQHCQASKGKVSLVLEWNVQCILMRQVTSGKSGNGRFLVNKPRRHCDEQFLQASEIDEYAIPELYPDIERNCRFRCLKLKFNEKSVINEKKNKQPLKYTVEKYFVKSTY